MALKAWQGQTLDVAQWSVTKKKSFKALSPWLSVLKLLNP